MYNKLYEAIDRYNNPKLSNRYGKTKNKLREDMLSYNMKSREETPVLDIHAFNNLLNLKNNLMWFLATNYVSDDIDYKVMILIDEIIPMLSGAEKDYR